MKKTRTARIDIRVPIWLKKAIQKYAESNHTNVSAIILAMLINMLQENDERAPRNK